VVPLSEGGLLTIVNRDPTTHKLSDVEIYLRADTAGERPAQGYRQPVSGAAPLQQHRQ
jgi:hypothetical protein